MCSISRGCRLSALEHRTLERANDRAVAELSSANRYGRTVYVGNHGEEVVMGKKRKPRRKGY